jgi:hypothetical protein
MCLQVPDDLTPLLFNVLACLLANQREMAKLLDPSSDKTKDLLKMTYSAFSVLLPILTNMQEIPTMRPGIDPVSPVPADVNIVPASAALSSSNAKRPPSAFALSVPVTCINVSEIGAEEKQSSDVQHVLPAGGFSGDFKRNVAASQEEQKTRRNVLLLRGVLDRTVTHADDLQLAQSLLSPCSNIASVVSASRIGTQQNILRVELDQPSARAVVDFFWANRQLFPSPTMSVAPSRVPSLQYAVRRMHDLHRVLQHRLPQLKPQVIKGTGLLLRGTDYFTAYAAAASGLLLSNGDAIPFFLLEKSDQAVIVQKRDRTMSDYYQAEDHFIVID